MVLNYMHDLNLPVHSPSQGPQLRYHRLYHEERDPDEPDDLFNLLHLEDD